jgi:hypothetical protein
MRLDTCVRMVDSANDVSTDRASATTSARPNEVRPWRRSRRLNASRTASRQVRAMPAMLPQSWQAVSCLAAPSSANRVLGSEAGRISRNARCPDCAARHLRSQAITTGSSVAERTSNPAPEPADDESSLVNSSNQRARRCEGPLREHHRDQCRRSSHRMPEATPHP